MGHKSLSDTFMIFLRERGITPVRTAVYHPAANGAIERFNTVLKDCVQSAIVQSKQWKLTVTDFLQVYCSTPHATTGVSPFELLHGRKMRTKLNGNKTLPFILLHPKISLVVLCSSNILFMKFLKGKKGSCLNNCTSMDTFCNCLLWKLLLLFHCN